MLKGEYVCSTLNFFFLFLKISIEMPVFYIETEWIQPTLAHFAREMGRPTL